MKSRNKKLIILGLLVNFQVIFSMSVDEFNNDSDHIELQSSELQSDLEKAYLERLETSQALEFANLAEKYPVLAEGVQLLGIDTRDFQKAMESQMAILRQKNPEFKKFVTEQACLDPKSQRFTECIIINAAVQRIEENIVIRASHSYCDVIELALKHCIDIDTITYPAFKFYQHYAAFLSFIEFDHYLEFFIKHMQSEPNDVDIKNLKYLLAQPGVDINSMNYKIRIDGLCDKVLACGLVHVAAQIKRSDILQLLIEHGADLELKYDGMYTPLHIAVHCGRIEHVRLLLKANPLLTGDSYTINSNPHSYGDVLSLTKGNSEVIKELLCSQAFVKRGSEDSSELLQKNKKRKL